MAKLREDSRLLGTTLVKGKALWRFSDFEYQEGTVKGEEEIEYWDLFQPTEIPKTKLDRFHKVRENEIGRLDNLAYKYYGNTKYFWVLARANNLVNPIDEMYTGMLLRIPNRSPVDTNLVNARNDVLTRYAKFMQRSQS